LERLPLIGRGIKKRRGGGGYVTMPIEDRNSKGGTGKGGGRGEG